MRDHNRNTQSPRENARPVDSEHRQSGSSRPSAERTDRGKASQPARRRPSASTSRSSARPTKRKASNQGAEVQGLESQSGQTPRRISQAQYTRQVQQKATRKRMMIIVASVLLIAVLGTGGAAFAYYTGISNNLHAGIDEDLKNQLVNSDITKEPFYLLLMGTDKSKDRANGGDFGESYRSDSIMLVRVDPVGKKVSLVSLHRDTLIDMGNNGKQKLNAAYAIGGPAYTVAVVSKLAGVPISHYAEINFDGFKDIVNALGGVDVEVPMEIDDPDAGGYLAAGPQTLNGDQALILCRARNAYDEYGDGDVYRAANQRLVIGAIAKKVLSADLATMTNSVSALSQYMTTDLEIGDILALAQALQGINVSEDIYSAMEPTVAQYIDGDGWYEYCSVSEWQEMMKRVDQGLPPTQVGEVDDASGTVLSSAGNASAS